MAQKLTLSDESEETLVNVFLAATGRAPNVEDLV